MNNKKLIKTLILGGSIATGFALNSTSVMAEELDEVVVNTNVSDSNGDQEEVNKVINGYNEHLQSLNDDADTLEGYEVAEKSYLEETQNYINNNWMTVEKANQIKSSSRTVEWRADETNHFAKYAEDAIKRGEADAENSFYEQAENNGLDEYTNECRDTEDIQEKAEIIDKSIEASNANCKAYVEAHADKLDAYNAIIDEVNKAEAAVEEAEKDLKWVEENYLMEQAAGEVDYRIVEDKNNLEKELENRKEELAVLKANEDYSVIGPEKRKNKDFVEAAEIYKNLMPIKSEAEIVAARVKAAHEKTVAYAFETKNLLNAFIATNVSTNDSSINRMMGSIVEIESGASDIEQNYNQVKELVDGDALTDEAAVSKIDNVSAALTRVQNATDSLQKGYNNVVVRTNNAKVDFENTAEVYGLVEYATKCQDTTNSLEKIGAIDNTIEAADKAHETFIADNADVVYVILDNQKRISALEAQIIEWEEEVAFLENRINSYYGGDYYAYLEYGPYIDDYEAIRDERKEMLAASRAEIVSLKSVDRYDLVTTEKANYESFINAAKVYSNTVAVMAEADVVYERGQNGFTKAVSLSTQLTDLIMEYDTGNIGDVSVEEKVIDLEIKNAQRNLVRAEIAFKSADDEFNLFAVESADARAEYDKLMKAKAEDPANEYIAKGKEYVARLNVIIDKFYEELAKGDFESEEYLKALEDFDAIDGENYRDRTNGAIEEWKHDLDSYDMTSYFAGYTAAAEKYDSLKEKRDEAAKIMADAQKKLDDLNAKKAQLGNAATENDTPVVNPETPAEETALSEDVYTVFNNVKAIVMENPELLQKVYALYNNEKAVDAAKYAYNYVVANADINTINYYAKQIAGMNITPEVVNTYLDMFTNWINK